MGNLPKKQSPQLVKQPKGVVTQPQLPQAVVLTVLYNPGTDQVVKISPVFPLQIAIEDTQHIIQRAGEALIVQRVLAEQKKQTQAAASGA